MFLKTRLLLGSVRILYTASGGIPSSNRESNLHKVPVGTVTCSLHATVTPLKNFHMLTLSHEPLEQAMRTNPKRISTQPESPFGSRKRNKEPPKRNHAVKVVVSVGLMVAYLQSRHLIDPSTVASPRCELPLQLLLKTWFHVHGTCE
jgi:hypothetical protein